MIIGGKGYFMSGSIESKPRQGLATFDSVENNAFVVDINRNVVELKDLEIRSLTLTVLPGDAVNLSIECLDKNGKEYRCDEAVSDFRINIATPHFGKKILEDMATFDKTSPD